MIQEFNNLLSACESAIETEEADNFDINNVVLTPAEESEIFMEGLRAACASDEEFASIVTESALEMELYGLIDSADTAYAAAGIATEGTTKKVVYKVTKNTTLSREGKKAAWRLCKMKAPTLYEKTIAQKKKYLTLREQVYQKFGRQGAVLAKKIMANGGKKAAAMSSSAGKDISEKIKSGIEKADKNGTNGAAIKR